MFKSLLTVKIALFPIRDDEKDWSGSEYLELYPVIGYIDNYQYSAEFNQYLFTGYYVFYHYGTKKAIKPKSVIRKFRFLFVYE